MSKCRRRDPLVMKLWAECKAKGMKFVVVMGCDTDEGRVEVPALFGTLELAEKYKQDLIERAAEFPNLSIHMFEVKGKTNEATE